MVQPVSGAFTGSVLGDVVLNAAGSASFIGTASLAETASHALDFDGNISASQVLPGSFQSGAYVFPDDVTINGTASITHLLVTTTSVINSSGSTIFGDTLDDTHKFTGSLLVTGSSIFDGPVTINDQLTADGITSSLFGTASWADNAVSASHAVNADTASVLLGSVESASFATKATVAPMNINFNSFFGAEAKLRVAVTVTEQDDGQRTVASLTGYTQTRVIFRVTRAPNSAPAGVVAVQGSLDDSAFVFLAGGTAGAGDGSPSGSMSGTIGSSFTVVSPWADITGTLAVDDVFLRWVTYSGSDAGGNNRPRIGSVNLQVR